MNDLLKTLYLAVRIQIMQWHEFFYIKVSIKKVTPIVDISIERSGILNVLSEIWQSDKTTKLIKTWLCLPQYSNSISSETKIDLFLQSLNRKLSLM